MTMKALPPLYLPLSANLETMQINLHVDKMANMK
jgi:hypothetical protein